MLIHTEKVSRKNSSFVSSGTSADFDNGILRIIRVSRNQKELDIFLHLRNLGFKLGNLFLCHLPEILILFVCQNILCGCYIVKCLLVLESGLDNRFEFLVILVELDIFLHIGHSLRAGELLLKILELVLQ